MMANPGFVCTPHHVHLSRQARRGRAQLASQRRHLLVANVTRRMADSFSNSSHHPVLEILKNRMNTGSKPGRRKDDRKVALCIEGGGMRGAVSAGMAAAIKYIGLQDAFDVVYGSSAGAIVGAYFVSRQIPVYGAQIYYDIICSIPENGQRFIDLWALRHHPYLRMKKRGTTTFYREGARPVLLLDRLIDDVMREQQPLDWKAFQKMHKVQPLKPVASSLLEMRAHTLDSFSTFDEFLECLRASARVPGIAGNPVEINGDLYIDSLMFEPIPYRSAVEEGCTDVLVLRTRTDYDTTKNVKPGIFEKHIARPYFHMIPSFSSCSDISDYLLSGNHITLYNDDVKRLQAENLNPRSFCDAAILAITPASNAPEVGQLESRARFVYEGVRNGFAAAYNSLSPFAKPSDVIDLSMPRKRGKDKGKQVINPGIQAARWVFPDEEIVRVEARHKSLRKKTSKRRTVEDIKVLENNRPSRRFWRSHRIRKRRTNASSSRVIRFGRANTAEPSSGA